jgi:small subunit ribosomal protein S1
MKDISNSMPSAKAEESFADMLNASFRPAARVRVGEVAEGRVIAVGKSGVFLDLGIRAEGMLEREDCERDGELAVRTGDVLQVLVTSFRDGIFHCTARLRQAGRGDARAAKDSPTLAMLREAFSGRIPVEGKVKGLNKGGFDVQVMGQKAFCPISQIEKGYCQKPEQHLEKTYSFLITQFEGDGRNIVVGRKELLQAEDKERSQRLWQELEVGQVRQGTVTSVHDYGAFVDIGGAEGLLHVSAISYQKVPSAKDVLHPGDKLNVAVIKLDPEAGRISLSAKALLADPWTSAAEQLVVGAELTGRVVHMKPFGAFIELFPGVTGLLHVSRLGTGRRINHPKEILTIDDEVRVRIQAVDPAQKTLSLTMEEPEEDLSTELERMKRKQEQEMRDSGGAMAGILDSVVAGDRE